MPYELTRREVVCGGLILAVSGGGSRNLHCTAYTGSGLAFAGVNLAGAEFGKVPGTYATDYTYPSPASIDYFSQPRLQPHSRPIQMGALAANACFPVRSR